MIIPQKMTAKLSNFEQLNERFGWYRFELEHPYRLENQAGQYMIIEVGEGVRRAYSMCDRPDVDSSFEIVLDYKPNGVGVNYIRNLQFGEVVHCMGPLGQLTVDEVDPKATLYLLATGSGISPFKAIVTDLLQLKHCQQKIVLIWNMNLASEFFWLEDLAAMQSAFPNFEFVPVVSQPDTSWTLARGFVADVLANYDLKSEDHFYLCGSPLMLNNTVLYLQNQRQVEKRQITTEQFFAAASR